MRNCQAALGTWILVYLHGVYQSSQSVTSYLSHLPRQVITYRSVRQVRNAVLQTEHNPFLPFIPPYLYLLFPFTFSTSGGRYGVPTFLHLPRPSPITRTPTGSIYSLPMVMLPRAQPSTMPPPSLQHSTSHQDCEARCFRGHAPPLSCPKVCCLALTSGT